MIGVGRNRDRNCGAPDAECRMTIVSGCIAESVLSVSTRDSPFDKLEPSPEIEIVSAPRRLAANSKLGAGARRGLEEQVDDRLAAQRIELLGRLVRPALVLPPAVKQPLDLVAAQALDPQQAALHGVLKCGRRRRGRAGSRWLVYH